MTSQVGSAEEIGKPWRLQELVDLSARAISNRISSGWCTLVSVVGFDDPALRLFAKPVAASLREAKVDRAGSSGLLLDLKLPAKPRLFYHHPPFSFACRVTATSTRLVGRWRQQVLYKELRSAVRSHARKTCAPSPVSSACSIPYGREKFAGRV